MDNVINKAQAGENRRQAFANNDKTYNGRPHKCGTTLKRTDCGACVLCSRERAKERARKRNTQTVNEQNRRWRQDNRELLQLRYPTYHQRYVQKNPLRFKIMANDRSKKHYQVHREIILERYRKQRYGLTDGQYQEMLDSQQGVCSVCRKPETSKHRSGNVASLSVDHDHVTGKVRGLLCRNCNTALGLVSDSPKQLLALADYLQRHGLSSSPTTSGIHQSS